MKLDFHMEENIMYEVTRDYRLVNGEEVETWKAEFMNANVLEVEAGTTGFKGGDTGHGGRTYFRLKDLGSTDIVARCSDEEVEIEFGGDTELQTFIQSLEFTLKVLKEQIEENK